MTFLRTLVLVALLPLLASAAVARPAMETNQLVDDAGTPIGTSANPLVTSGGASVTPGGTNGSQAQAVQGIPNGVPLNAFPAQFNSSLPTLATGATGYLAVDQNGRLILSASSQPLTVQIAGGANTIGNAAPASTATAVGPAPLFSIGGSSLVGKAAAGNLYGFSITTSGTAAYLVILNTASAPASGASLVPLECVPVAANSYVARRQDIPDRYSTGIVAVVSSSCTTFTAVAPQVVSLIVQ